MKTVINCRSAAIVLLFGLASSLVLGAPVTQPIQQEERSALFPSADMISQGRAVAETACESCHGMDGISNTDGEPNLAGQRVIYLYRAQQAYHSGARNDETKKHNGFLNDAALPGFYFYCQE